MLWLILLAILIAFACFHIYKNVNYWRDRNVTHARCLPILGNLTGSLFRTRSFPEDVQHYYKMFPDAKYIGIHQFSTPLLMVRDPELLKQITVKDFDSFMNHRVIFTEETEPLLGKNLISLKGQKWKDMRSTLSPAFTSSKMRAMFSLMTECAEQFTDYFLNEAKKNNGTVTVEMKDVFTRYTSDVIATTAFGIQCDSLKHKENEFYMAGKNSTNFGTWALIKMAALIIMPKVMQYTGITLVQKSIARFFSDLIINTVKTREEKGIIRPDMIHLLMQAQKGNLKHETVSEDAGFATVEESSIGKSQALNKQVLTNEDIVAQAFIFFFAGYDTGSTVMSFLAYELALNPEVQKKLQKEVDEVVSKGKIDYESVLKMKYLDMVISETLRKWPPVIMTDRVAERPYTINISNDNEPQLTIEKGVGIGIPTYAIHRDETYFPNPDKFDPERFSDENKHTIVPFTYLPFGVGPRNCIGSRFALLEIKILFVHLLSKLELTVTEKTQIPIKLDKTKLNFTTENGIWLGLKPRMA